MSVKADTHAVVKSAHLASLPADTPPALVSLQEGIRGFVSVPGMPDYGAASAVNRLYPSNPLGVVFCATETDVALALQCAQAEGWPLRARPDATASAGSAAST